MEMNLVYKRSIHVNFGSYLAVCTFSFFSSWSYNYTLKLMYIWFTVVQTKYCSDYHKIWTIWFYHRVMCPQNRKQCRPWLDFSSRSSLTWTLTACPNLSVQKLRIITEQYFRSNILAFKKLLSFECKLKSWLKFYENSFSLHQTVL